MRAMISIVALVALAMALDAALNGSLYTQAIFQTTAVLMQQIRAGWAASIGLFIS